MAMTMQDHELSEHSAPLTLSLLGTVYLVLFSSHHNLSLRLSLSIYSLECGRAPVTDLLLLCHTSFSILDVAVLD